MILWTEEASPPEYEEHFDEVVVGGAKPTLAGGWVFTLKRGERISPQLLADVRAIVHNREGLACTGVLIPMGKGSRRGERRLLKSLQGKTSKWITSCSSRRMRYYIYERINS